MSGLDHDQIEGLLGAFALDAVGPDEAEAVERHLAECPRCRAEVDAGREVAGHLGTSTRVGDSEPLPEGLWDRIAGGLGNAPSLTETLPRPAPLGQGGANVVDLEARTARRRRPPRWAAVAAAVAVAAIAVLGVRLGQIDHQLGNANHALESKGLTATVQAALRAPTHRLVQLDSPRGSEVAEIVVLSDGQGYLASSSMAPLPAGETYQLWAIRHGRPVSMGLLGRHPGLAAFSLASTQAPSVLAVTVEPAGGVVAPDHSPVASGRLT